MTGGAAHTLQIHSRNAKALQKGFRASKVVETVAAAVGKAIVSATKPIRLVRASGVFDVFEDVLIDFICLLAQGHAVFGDLGQDLITHLVHHFPSHHIRHLRLRRRRLHRLLRLGNGDLNGHFSPVSAAVGGRIDHRILAGLCQIHLTGIDLKLHNGIHVVGHGHTFTVGNGTALHHFQILGAGNHRGFRISRRFRCRFRGRRRLRFHRRRGLRLHGGSGFFHRLADHRSLTHSGRLHAGSRQSRLPAVRRRPCSAA